MIGITLGDRCAAVANACADAGVLVNCAADGNLRLVPPLVITDDEIDRVCAVLHEAVG